MNIRKRKQKKLSQQEQDFTDSDTVIDLEEKREIRRRQLREAAAEVRRRRGEPENGLSDYTYYGSNLQAKEPGQAEGFDEDDDYAAESRKEPETHRQRVKRRKKRLILPLRIAVTVIAIFVAVGVVLSSWKIVSLKMEESERQDRIKELETQKKEMQQEIGRVGTDEYIEEQAREWLKMAKSGEIIYIFEDDDENQNTKDAEH